MPGKHTQSWKTYSVHSEILDDRNQHKKFPQNTNSTEGPEHCQSHFHLFSQVPKYPCYCRHRGRGRSPAVLCISVSMPLLLGKPLAAAAAKSFQSCPTLCDPIDGSPPGSLVPGILQARTLEWAAISVHEFHSGEVMAKFLPFQSLLMLLRSWLQTTPPHQQCPELGARGLLGALT